MKNTQSLLLLVGLLFCLIACGKEESVTLPPTQENVVIILPLGDSRVEGSRPDFESYRPELWKKLVVQGFAIDFVGTRLDESNYADFMGQSFDQDHQGTGGAQTTDILRFLNNLEEGTSIPDMVLLGIGGNDLIDGQKTVAATINNINQIIDWLQERNDTITILLEQIAPGRSDFMTNELTLLFNQFNQEILDVGLTQTTTNSKVVIVDMASTWSDAYMADEVHYNEAGSAEVAGRYFEAMKPLLDK